MTTCHDMKKGDIFVCTDCGLELEVIKECYVPLQGTSLKKLAHSLYIFPPGNV